MVKSIQSHFTIAIIKQWFRFREAYLENVIVIDQSVINIAGNEGRIACRKSDWKSPQVLDTIPWDIIRISVLSIRWSPHHSEAETKSFIDKMTGRRYKLVQTTDTGKWIFLYNTVLKIWSLTQVNAMDWSTPASQTVKHMFKRAPVHRSKSIPTCAFRLFSIFFLFFFLFLYPPPIRLLRGIFFDQRSRASITRKDDSILSPPVLREHRE